MQLSKKSLKKYNELETKMGDNYYILPRREIENLLSKEVLKKTIMSYQEKDSNAKLHTIEFEDYKTERIGNYIGKQIIEEKQFKAFLCPPSKNNCFIRNKREFANNAIKHIKNWNDLSEDAQNLTRRIYNFITKHNSK